MRWLKGMALFPLLRKDLAEMAQRRRTYLVRTAAALLLFGSFLMFFEANVSSSQLYAGSALGSGRDVFDFVLAALFIAIYVLLPATMSGALTYEKERQTMALLLLTDLRPTEILMEKFLGRLFSMFAFLLLALPLLAVAYAYGGVPTDMIESLGLPLVHHLPAGRCAGPDVLGILHQRRAGVHRHLPPLLPVYAGPALVMGLMGALRLMPASTRTSPSPSSRCISCDDAGVPRRAGALVARSIPILLSAGLFLLMARVFIVRRAFAMPGHTLRRFFRRMDGFWQKANWLTGGIVLVREADTLPDRRPITWREVRTRSLARFSYLFRILCAVEVPVLLVVAVCLVGSTSWYGDADALSATLFVLWPMAALALAVVAGNIFPSERVSQTLDLLLTTPMTGAEIVRQKVRALRRFMAVLAAPLLTVYVAEALVETRPDRLEMWTYLGLSLLPIIVYFPLITWLSVWIGLKVRSRAGATVLPVLVVTLWCAVPPLIVVTVAELLRWRGTMPFTLLMLGSPATMVVLPEQKTALFRAFRDSAVAAVIVNYVVYGGIALVFRTLCLKRADLYLGRVPEGLPPEPNAPAKEASDEAP